MGDVLPPLCFGSSVLLCVMAFVCLLSSLHTRVHSGVSCRLLAAFRVARSWLGRDVLVAVGREQRWKTCACTAAHASCKRPLGDCRGGDRLPQGKGCCSVTAG